VGGLAGGAARPPPRSRHWPVVALGSGAAIAVAGVLFAGAEAGMPDLADPAVVEAGQALYREKHCSHCHGATGQGGVNLVKRDLSNPAYVFEAIAAGRERGSIRMPAFREMLSDEEIWQTAAYVMSLGRK